MNNILTIILPSVITGVFGVVMSVLSYKLGNRKNHEKQQGEALNLLLRSQIWCLKAFQQLRNPETNEPLINGESHALVKEIEGFRDNLTLESLQK